MIKLQSKFGDYKIFLRTKETAKKIKVLENNNFDTSEMYQENQIFLKKSDKHTISIQDSKTIQVPRTKINKNALNSGVSQRIQTTAKDCLHMKCQPKHSKKIKQMKVTECQ